MSETPATTSADLSNTDLTGAELCASDLTGANLTNAVLTGVNLLNAVLAGARGMPATGMPVGWAISDTGGWQPIVAD